MLAGLRAMGSGDLSRWVRDRGRFRIRRSPSAPSSGVHADQFPAVTEAVFLEIVPKTVRLPADVVEEFLGNSIRGGDDPAGAETITYSLSRQVKRLLQKMLADRISQCNSESQIDKAAYLHSLGALIDDEEEYAHAEAPLGASLKLRTQALGAEHRDTLFTRHLLGLVWMSQDSSSKLAKAEATLSECLETQTRVLGEDDPDTLRTMNGLGALHYTKGSHSEAEALYSKCLQKRLVVLGSAHKDTLATIHNLSLLYKGERGHTAALLKLAFL